MWEILSVFLELLSFQGEVEFKWLLKSGQGEVSFLQEIASSLGVGGGEYHTFPLFKYFSL